MSFNDSSTVPMQCKHTISECVTHNGDPLAVRKNTHEAAKKAAITPFAAKKVSQV